MRIRYMKPGFFKNEDLSTLPPLTRLCFAGLWLMADKAGRLEDRPRRIKGELFAYENADVEAMLAELTSAGFLDRYTADGVGIIQIVNFMKHQRPHKDEPVSHLPECVDSQWDCVDSQPKPANIVRELELERRTGTDRRPAKTPTPTQSFLEWFVTQYAEKRSGAKYVISWPKHAPIVGRLLKIHGPDRLQQHAEILLTTDEDWTETTDRGIEVLAGKINWLEERLVRWEKRKWKQASNG